MKSMRCVNLPAPRLENRLTFDFSLRNVQQVYHNLVIDLGQWHYSQTSMAF